MASIREELLTRAREKRPLLPITVWGKDLFIRRMSGRERDAYESSLVQVKGKSRSVNLVNLRARLAVLCLVDEEGKRVFTDGDADELGLGDCVELDKIYTAAREHNGLDKEELDDAEKNSLSTQPDASTSG